MLDSGVELTAIRLAVLMVHPHECNTCVRAFQRKMLVLITKNEWLCWQS